MVMWFWGRTNDVRWSARGSSLLLEDYYPHDTCALFLINGYIRDLNSQAYELSYFM